MRIELGLYVEPPRRAEAEAAWVSSGGDPGKLTDPSFLCPLFAPDESSPDGRLVLAVARALGSTSQSEDAPLYRTARFEDEDYDRAELFDVGVGDVTRTLDPDSLEPERRCEACGLKLPRRAGQGGLRLRARAKPAVDLLNEHDQWLVSEPLADRLAPLPGVVLVPLSAAPAWSRLTAACRLGHECDTDWGPPCQDCGQRLGEMRVPWIAGLSRYPRTPWSGEAIATGIEAIANLYVSRQVREILMEPGWRFPRHQVSFRPIVQ